VINYGPGEEALAEAIKVASRSADPVAYSGTLEKLMALARNALCVVGGDTGPLHLAVAVGTPSVSIYGPTDPARNGPFPNPAPAFVGARHVAPELAQAQTSPPDSSSLCAPQELSANSGDEDPDASETAHRNVILRAPTAIRDHSRIDETDPAILKISVDEVFAAVRRIVGAPA
jgi:hypothetical protein